MPNLAILDKVATQLKTLTIDEIKDLLQPLFVGLRVKTPIIDPGTFLYRARRITSTFNKASVIRRKDLVYPSKEYATLNRLNRPGDALMYCSAGKESLFFELQDLQVDDEIVLTIWQTTAPLLVNNIGYTDDVFRTLGAKRQRPTWVDAEPKRPGSSATITLPEIHEPPLSSVFDATSNGALLRALSKFFMHRVEPDETYKYKLTVAIGELHMGVVMNHPQHDKFSGIVYPSVRMWANGDNVALLPDFVDRALVFKKAIHVRVESRTDSTFQITSLDAATSFNANGELQWLGRLLNWTLAPGQAAKFTVKSGRAPDGDYSSDKDGNPCHWVARDSATGRIISPK